MAYDCRVYRILIASPSDVDAERECAVRVIQEWNDLNSYSRKVALLPLRWETHTAPELGRRPQEVINRAIVDNCDLLVGIFWTRIGSPTGSSESGTLEEIERVGKLGKPIMLYFSNAPIGPDKIETDQIMKLRVWREKTYPNGLVEKYSEVLEFRDKFVRQLEMKVRDLRLIDEAGEEPLTLEFLSIDKGEQVGSSTVHAFEHIVVSGYHEVPEEHRERVRGFAGAIIKERSYCPVAMSINNSSVSGVRNLYVEVEFFASSNDVELTASPSTGIFGPSSGWTTNITYWDQGEGSELARSVEQKLSKFDAGTLQVIEGGWKFGCEWDALQPQRRRLIKPVVFVYSSKPAKLSIKARVFADAFPKPIVLEATMNLEPTQKVVQLGTWWPEWRKLIEETETPTVFSFSAKASGSAKED
jgi:hypothetical protein